jgi:hypothetical protein
MRWPHVAVAILSTSLLTGCPSEFGKDGRVAKAVSKDAQEQIIIIKQCTRRMRDAVCGHGQQNSKECLECGGP